MTGRAPVRPGGIEVAIVSGLSGAGRSTAAKVLEDLGWFVVDNLPPELIETMVDLGARSSGQVTRIAVVMDVRSRAFTADLGAVIKELDARGHRPRVLFLDASDAVLIRRFESNRRSHPLQGDGRLVDGIVAERELLAPLHDQADLVVDTSNRSVHQLRAAIESAFADAVNDVGHSVTVVSFGYKHGLPLDVDLVFDCRFLPNPNWVDELRPLDGRDAAVREYVLGQPETGAFLAKLDDLLALLLPAFVKEGKSYLSIAVGCTGGRHRSVVLADELAALLAKRGFEPTVQHRDVDR
jgi:UPF0042 nucleotide-binding protein